LIRTYEVQLIPGLLQTREYARALLMLGFGHTPLQEIDDRVNVRLSRQNILTKDDPPTLWTVIDEAALHRPFGGREVMRQQLQRLIEASEMPNVLVQIVRFSSGAHSGAGAPFTWLDRKSTRLNSSHVKISYAVFCLKKKIRMSRT